MLYRKIEKKIEDFLTKRNSKMLVVDGARQVGKSFIIRQIGRRLFKNYIEVNMEQDRQGRQLFKNAMTVEDFLVALSTIHGDKMGSREDTIVFIDEIQAYEHLLTLAKFLIADGRFTYIASGSQLGIALKTTQSLPIGSIELIHMYPLDFEEFLIANGVGKITIDSMYQCYLHESSLQEEMHHAMMDYFRKYLLVGGMPEAVNTYLAEHNLVAVRKVQNDILTLYRQDAAKYEKESNRKLVIQRIYDMIPSNLENKKKRIVAKDIDGKQGRRMSDYRDEFEYLIAAGIALEVKAISKPTYPLVENSGKNLLKLYINDIGLLTGIIYRNNIQPVMNNVSSVNLGAVYENVVAQELRAHGFPLFYYDNKKHGEVDYLVDDADNLSVMPIEVKSGKDYYIHSALNHFINTEEYHVKRAIVLSGEPTVTIRKGITYMPIYFSMFLKPSISDDAEFIRI